MAANGHLTVPSSGAWAGLNSWVNYQRRRQETLSHERRAALEELGVCWAKRRPQDTTLGATEAGRQKMARSDDDKWGERLEELRAFTAVNGNDARVPTKTHAALHFWLRSQRKICHKGALTDERRYALERMVGQYRLTLSDPR